MQQIAPAPCSPDLGAPLPAGAVPAKPADKRVLARMRVLKGAKVVFNGSVIDCTLRNISPRGVRVSTGAPMPLPDHVTLHLQGGAVFHARRRWSRGLDAGFELIGPVTLATSAAARALPLYEALKDASPLPVLTRLHQERCFDDPALRSLALRLGDAYAALATAMKSFASEAHIKH